MSPLVAKLLRALGLVAYAGVVVAVFLGTAYVAFSLFVRSGTTAAPDLAGLSQQAASGTLSDAGLDIRVNEGAGRFDPEIPAGHVVAQHPPPRTLVKRGSGVQVTLSLGPQRVTVPDLVGHSMQSAQVALAAAGLAPGRTMSVFSRDAEPGTVVQQRPGPGSAVAPSAAVDLMLVLPGSTPTYVMPDLVYRDYDRVRRFFDQRGFRFGSIKFEPYEGVPYGVILRQFPLAGHPLARTDAISLVVAAEQATDFPPAAALGVAPR
jgi:serine/threonine-protein kinase